MPRLTIVTTPRDILVDSTPAKGGFVLDDKNTLERHLGARCETRHDDELLDVFSPTTRRLLGFTAANEAISTRRGIQIPIAAMDFVTLIRHPTAVSCIVPYQTPAR